MELSSFSQLQEITANLFLDYYLIMMIKLLHDFENYNGKNTWWSWSERNKCLPLPWHAGNPLGLWQRITTPQYRSKEGCAAVWLSWEVASHFPNTAQSLSSRREPASPCVMASNKSQSCGVMGSCQQKCAQNVLLFVLCYLLQLPRWVRQVQGILISKLAGTTATTDQGCSENWPRPGDALAPSPGVPDISLNTLLFCCLRG